MASCWCRSLGAMRYCSLNTRPVFLVVSVYRKLRHTPLASIAHMALALPVQVLACCKPSIPNRWPIRRLWALSIGPYGLLESRGLLRPGARRLKALYPYASALIVVALDSSQKHCPSQLVDALLRR